MDAGVLRQQGVMMTLIAVRAAAEQAGYSLLHR
jgi:hypothetical protein